MKGIDIIVLKGEVPGNAGSICRAIANFGIGRLILINPQYDLTHKDIFRFAKHANKTRDQIKVQKRLGKYDLLIGTTARIGSDKNSLRTPTFVRDAVKKVQTYQKAGKRVGILFGGESCGLSNEDLAKCHITCTIPATADYGVLNLSQAATIFLYELSYAANEKKIQKQFTPAGTQEFKEIKKVLSSSFGKTQKGEKYTDVLYTLLKKSLPTKREAFTLLGALKELGKKKE